MFEVGEVGGIALDRCGIAADRGDRFIQFGLTAAGNIRQMTATYRCRPAAALVAELKNPGRPATSVALDAGSDRSS